MHNPFFGAIKGEALPPVSRCVNAPVRDSRENLSVFAASSWRFPGVQDPVCVVSPVTDDLKSLACSQYPVTITGKVLTKPPFTVLLKMTQLLQNSSN